MTLAKETEAKYRKEINSLKAALAEAKTAAKKNQAAVEGEVAELKMSVQTRFSEIAQLIRLLEEKEGASRSLRPIVERPSSVRSPLTFVKRLRRVFRKGVADRRQADLLATIAVVRQSLLFDVEWYLRQYPDVADAGIDPVVHWIKYGAAEGRRPSYDFDTRKYVEQFPDVDWRRVNPLVHYMSASKK